MINVGLFPTTFSSYLENGLATGGCVHQCFLGISSCPCKVIPGAFVSPQGTVKLKLHDRKRGIHVDQPKANYAFSSQRKTLSLLHTLFNCPRRSLSQLPVLPRWVTTAEYSLRSPKWLDLSWSVFCVVFFKSERTLYNTYSFLGIPLFCLKGHAFFPVAILPSTFLLLLLCQDSLQEWGLYEDIISWERNVIKSNI